MAKNNKKFVYSMIVVIVREGEKEVVPFEDEDEAREFFEKASLQWSDSFLCKVVKGPVV